MNRVIATGLLLVSLLLCPALQAADAVVLSWSDCLREAARQNPQLDASARQVEQRRQEKRMVTAQMLPQISAQASASRAGELSGGDTWDNNTYSANGQQLIFDGFKTYNEFKSAEQGLDASRHAFTSTSSAIRYNLRSAFVGLLRTQALVPIAQKIIERRRQNLEMIRLKYDSGREHVGALQLAEADLAQAEYDLRKARRDNSAAQYALRKELGWQSDAPIVAKGSLELEERTREQPDLRDIAERHPAVMQVASEKEAAKFDLGAAKAEFFPTFDLTAQAGKVGFGGFQSDNGWTVALNATMPIFEGGGQVANERRARQKLFEATSTERSQHDTVLSGLENSWQTLEDAVEFCGLQGKYLAANETRAKISRAQYANGLLIFDNWVIIEDNYIKSQMTYVNSQAAMMIAEAAWIKAKGEALEHE